MALDLGGDNLLLQSGQQLLGLVPPQTQIGDVDEVIGSIDPHDIKAAPFTLGVDLHQPHNPTRARPQNKDGRQNTRADGRHPKTWDGP